MNFLGNNGRDLMKEGVMDGAFAYAVSQVMKPGDRSDPRHSDGGISFLHMGLSIAGEMAVQCWFKQGHASKTLQQRPGSIYISNMCTVEHQVADASCFLVKLLTRPGVGRDSLESVRKRSNSDLGPSTSPTGAQSSTRWQTQVVSMLNC